MSKLATVLEKHIKDEKIRQAILDEMKSSRATNVKYVRTGAEVKVKLAPQAVKILDAVDAKEPRDATTIASIAVDNGLVTRQEPARIFAWYRTVLLENNLIKSAS